MTVTVGRWTVDDDTREWVAANVAAAPPLTNEQRTRLAELLAPVRRRPATPASMSNAETRCTVADYGNPP